jgi:hypothetical protein
MWCRQALEMKENDMHCEQHLALTAILTGLRRSGALDKGAIRSVVLALRETAVQAQRGCPEAAGGLLQLADALEQGPMRTCIVEVAA